MAKPGLVVAGILIMVLLGWIPLLGWFVLGPIGFIMFIVGLVSNEPVVVNVIARV